MNVASQDMKNVPRLSWETFARDEERLQSPEMEMSRVETSKNAGTAGA